MQADPEFRAIMMSMASSLDQILKNTAVPHDRRRSTSAPPGRRATAGAPGDPNGPDDPTDPKGHRNDPKKRSGDLDNPIQVPSPSFAAVGLPAALAALLPSLTTTATKMTTKKSGEARSASDRVVREVIWPHEKIRAENGEPLTAQNVSQEQWSRGMVELIEEASYEDQRHMLHFFKESLLDIERSDWKTVRNFSTRIFHEFEADRLTWANRQGINMERLRFLYAASRPSALKSNQQHQLQAKVKSDTPKPTLESVHCQAYNEGTCQNKAIFHDGVWHMCSFCSSVRG